jgi:hypothetical protein
VSTYNLCELQHTAELCNREGACFLLPAFQHHQTLDACIFPLQERFIGRLSEMLLDTRVTQEIRRIWGMRCLWLLIWLCLSGVLCSIDSDALCAVCMYVLMLPVPACSGLHDPVRCNAGQEACSQAEAAFCAVDGLRQAADGLRLYSLQVQQGQVTVMHRVFQDLVLRVWPSSPPFMGGSACGVLASSDLHRVRCISRVS